MMSAFSSSKSHPYKSIPSNDPDFIADPESSSSSNTHKEIESQERSDNRKFYGVEFLVLLIILSCIYGIYHFHIPVKNSMNVHITANTPRFDIEGRYVLKNYDQAKPMSDFLNGLGGLWGIPMWAFFNNRGQAIASFGIQNKDNAIYKFYTAEKAYQQNAFTGFRTFIKGTVNGKKQGASWNHMPFFPTTLKEKDNFKRDMMIGENEMEIEEIAHELNLKTNVLYFTAPNEAFPCLVRQTTFTNMDETETMTLEVLDGLARLQPFGLANGEMDAVGRTREAWMTVYNVGTPEVDGNTITQPFFHISQGTQDTAQVKIIEEAHFVISFLESDVVDEGAEGVSKGQNVPIPLIVDPNVVFGTDTTLMEPKRYFSSSAPPVETFIRKPQVTTSRTPCAFAGATMSLSPGQRRTVTTVFGHATSLKVFLDTYSPIILTPGFAKKKRNEAKVLVRNITSLVESRTSNPVLNGYIKQNFLDNVLRGGLPLQLGTEVDSELNPDRPLKIFHTYSRIHGDLERDYNDFQIDATYYSSGPGAFRDVCQNRRMDLFYAPYVKDFNARMFLSFVQSDGYNPLTVAATNFKIPTREGIARVIQLMGVIEGEVSVSEANTTAKVEKILKQSFRPGQLFHDLAAAKVNYMASKEAVLDGIMKESIQDFAGRSANNAFWSDHWTYILDLVDNYLTIYPDKEEAFLWDADPIPFYLSPAIVRPRDERYTLISNPDGPSPPLVLRAYYAVGVNGDKDYDSLKAATMSSIWKDPATVGDPYGSGGFWQRSRSGLNATAGLASSVGAIFTVSPIVKLVMMAVLKFSTLDPYGMGVEMEAGKPGWNDAMNGLPGIVGSGMPETYEMIRTLRFIIAALKKYGRSVDVPVEFMTFMTALVTGLQQYNVSPQDTTAEQIFWEVSNTARETYRAETLTTFDGAYTTVLANDLRSMLEMMDDKATHAAWRSVDQNNGLSPTYFYYECNDVTIDPPNENTVHRDRISCRAFRQKTLPLFLEGPTRHMKITTTVTERRTIYHQTKSSPLYDTALKMFAISGSLAPLGQDIGRMKAFSPGWLENQSIWLHMSYKFYLELLRGGLYEEFYHEIRSGGLVPFMNDKVYGRSPLEAVSFIASSAFPDPELHGTGFLARLSGSTAEFLSMWGYMMAGPKPFTVNESDGGLELNLQPKLPGWLFDDQNTVAFTFLGGVKVTYVNPQRKDTWKLLSVTKVVMVDINDNEEVVEGVNVFPLSSQYAMAIRNAEIQSLFVYY